MKKNSILFIILFIITSCTVSSEPKFVKIDNIYPQKVSLLGVELTSDAIFYNPNDIGCELVATDISVLVNGNEVGKANQAKNIEITSKGEFTIPLKISFSPMKIIESKEELLNNSLSNLLKQKVEITYKGTIMLKKAGISFEIPIDKTDEIQLKK